MSIFGEIVEPGTRTAWEDWDENVHDDGPSRLSWQHHIDSPEQIYKLYILEGRHLSKCVTTLNNCKLTIVNSIPEVNLNLYKTEGSDSYVCILKDYNLLLASEIIELMKPYISLSTDVISILTKPLVEYQAVLDTAQEYIMRTISTSKPLSGLEHTKNIPRLEQPNIISGVTAGVISLREISNQSGLAIICFVEHNEEYQLNCLQDLLLKLNFGLTISQASSILNSNLYI